MMVVSLAVNGGEISFTVGRTQSRTNRMSVMIWI